MMLWERNRTDGLRGIEPFRYSDDVAFAARAVSIPIDESGSVRLPGYFAVPERARGVVVFAHASGSTRDSPRNRFVAELFRRNRLGTLLLDLLTADEEAADAFVWQLRFDVDLLSRRLVAATRWALGERDARGLPVGYFGASTGAAAALVAAAALPGVVLAVASRGGQPDLAWDALPHVRAATRFIVGDGDPEGIALNTRALEAVFAPKDLVVVKGATHLFAEPGALEEIAELSADWFVRHLRPHRRERPLPSGPRRASPHMER